MFGFNYGNYNAYGNGYNGNGNFDAFPATTKAMQAYTGYSNVVGDQTAWSNPNLAGQTQFLNGIAQSAQTARRGVAAGYGGGNPPVDPSNMSLEEFLRWAAQTRQNAGPTRPQRPPVQNGPQSSPLDVHAHAYQDQNGNSIPVVSTTVNETGNWRSRQTDYNQAGYTEFDTTYGNGKMGKYYTVTVTWKDGRTQSTQVQDKGYAVEVW